MDDSTAPPPSHPNFFRFGCMVELSLGVIAYGLAWGFEVPLNGMLHWRWQDAFLGLWASLPLFSLFFWTLSSPAEPLLEIRLFLEKNLAPLMADWSVARYALLSVLAGVCEEFLFRGVIQGGLTPVLGGAAAILASGILFGLFHKITWAYAVMGGLIGIYLGLLGLLANNLLVPMLIHAVYDFGALVYFFKVRGLGRSPAPKP
jgi:membrane protease YdiL (CAAX protease family)